MKPELQRIAVLESLGWINQGKRKGVPALYHRWVKPDGEIYSGSGIPDYLNDRQAIVEAILTLTDHQRDNFVLALCDVLGISNDAPPDLSETFRLATATAAQLTEAYLRALNLWTTEP